MKKLALIMLIALTGTTAAAYTHAEFAGLYGIIRMVPKDQAGNADTDTVTLYRQMDVPIKDSMLGPGKTIQTAERALQFICAIRNGTDYECAIFIQSSANSTVNPLGGYMQYKLTGPAADVYAKMFRTNADGNFDFVNTEGTFKVTVKPHYFEVLFNKNNQGLIPATKTLVVAQVEDTLKVTHTPNFWDSLNYIQDSESRFLGMSETLSLLVQDKPWVQIAYMIQPPELVIGKFQAAFLKQQKFPAGRYVYRSENYTLEERLESLRKLVLAEAPERVVLIGNNGGDDVELFQKFAQEFPQIEFVTYIHVLYSTNATFEVGRNLYARQTGYVTALELLFDLQQRKLVETVASEKLAQLLLPQVLTETVFTGNVGNVAIPTFAKCENFFWIWDISAIFKFM
ncbi:MAG: DUF2183 domain-containing protein, partial [Proteobacteria bacterium]